MNVFLQVGVASLAWAAAARGLGRATTWIPALGLIAVEGMVLFLLAGFTLPVLTHVALPLVRLLGGEAATHYPGHLYALPMMFAAASHPLRSLVLPFVYGALCTRYATLYGIGDLARDCPHRSRTWFALAVLAGILGWAPEFCLEAFAWVAAKTVPSLLVDRPIVHHALYVVFLMILVHAAPAIVLGGKGPLAALATGVRKAIVLAVPTLLVVLVPLAILYPLTVVVPRIDLEQLSLRPEIGPVLVALRIVLETLAVVIVAGASTRLFLGRRAGAR
jgi:hypothetical protein